MAINRTIDLLPEYFRTISNQRFLNSTLDRLVSEPTLRNFDGYVGRHYSNGQPLDGSYVTEPSGFREKYQLEPEYVYSESGTTSRSAGFLDVLNSVAIRGGVVDSWNKLTTDNSYSYRGFVDLDKLTNYYNYVWIPEARTINNTLIDENVWFRHPVEITNSAVPTSGTFEVIRTARGFQVVGYEGLNPTLHLVRGGPGSYSFNIQPNTTGVGSRIPKVVLQSNSVYSVVASNENVKFNNIEFNNTSAYFSGAGPGGTGSGLYTSGSDDFNFKSMPFTVECWINVSTVVDSNDHVIVGQWKNNNNSNNSWALMQTTHNGSPTVKFVWIDVDSGEQNELMFSDDSGLDTLDPWHHVAVARLSNTVRLYIDGQLVNSTSISSISRSDRNLTVGVDTSNNMAFKGYMDDLRISKNIARYASLTYDVPTSNQVNDSYTVFKLSFDAPVDGIVFYDDVQTTYSRVWIQTHAGMDGTIPYNPNLSARLGVDSGVQDNGTSTGSIVFSVPSLEDESYYRTLKTTGVEYFDKVDLATNLNFDQINNAIYDNFIKVPSLGTRIVDVTVNGTVLASSTITLTSTVGIIVGMRMSGVSVYGTPVVSSVNKTLNTVIVNVPQNISNGSKLTFSTNDEAQAVRFGGIDGVKDLDGKTVVFAANQTTGWYRSVPIESDNLEEAGYDQVEPIPENQKFGIWRILVKEKTFVNDDGSIDTINIINLEFLQEIAQDYRVDILGGVDFRNTSWYKTSNTSFLYRVPLLSGNYTTLFFQDDQNINNSLKLNIINSEIPALDIERDILCQPEYTSGNGVEFIDGLHIKFASDCLPTKYVEKVLVNRVPLTETINDSQTYVKLSSIEDVVIGDYLKIEDELMLVTDISSVYNNGYTVTVLRAQDSTPAIGHAYDAGILVRILRVPSYIIEGVGDSITLVPYYELETVESYMDLAQDPDYITINRSSLDRNPWSRTNRWFNRQVIDKSIEYLTAQGVNVETPTIIHNAVRPIVEFTSGLCLYNFGTMALSPVDVIDDTINDALSNVNGRRITDTQAITIDGHILQDLDRVIFNNDKNPDVRRKIYQVEYVDVDGNYNVFSRPAAKYATSSNISLSSPGITGLLNNDRVLVWKQNNASQNGVYYYNGSTLVRATDANTPGAFREDFFIFVQQGTYANTWFRYENVTPYPQVTRTLDGAVLGSTVITLLDVTGIVTGMSMTGTGVAAGTIVQGIDTILKTVELSVAQTLTDGISLTFNTFLLDITSDPTAVVFDTVTDQGPVVRLKEVETANVDNCVVIAQGSEYRGTNWKWPDSDSYWKQSVQSKTQTNQFPTFDVFNYTNESFSNTSVYDSSDFTGSTLFEYTVNEDTTPDPVLNFGLTYRNINNVGDISFTNSYDTDDFVYQSDPEIGTSKTTKINTGVPFRLDPCTGELGQYSPWQLVLTDRELYQNLEFLGADLLLTSKVRTQTVVTKIVDGVNVVLDNVSGIEIDMIVSGVGISGTPLVKLINLETKTITLDLPQTISDGTLLSFNSGYQINIIGQLLKKYTTVTQKTKIYIDGTQMNSHAYTVDQVGNQIRLNISSVVLSQNSEYYLPITANSKVLIKIIADGPISGAWYDVPVQYEINPFNQLPTGFTTSDLKAHADFIHSNHGHAITPFATDNNLNNTEHQTSPGLILLHETFSVLPTTLLTDVRYDVELAIKSAGREYSQFKMKFLNTADQVEGVETMKVRQAVDEVFAILMANNTTDQAWYTSDMVPVNGTVSSYTIEEIGKTSFDISEIFVNKASNKAILVYLNDYQLIRGVDYEFDSQSPVVNILHSLHVNDLLEIVEYSDTDGSCMPATPAKLGLGAVYVPDIYTDTTYRESANVIQGHDGSITVVYGDYRDQLMLELERRIFNNIKVDSAFWNNVIQSRVPAAGKFRDLNRESVYNLADQAHIQRKLFYEWVAINRVDFAASVYDSTDSFTYNYSGTLDRITNKNLLGYWRGIYREFYDTDRPHTHPWEMAGFSVKPTWWEADYGPAPYTAGNQILWTDLQNGYSATGRWVSPLGSRTTGILNSQQTGTWNLLDILPVDDSGILLSPSDCISLSPKTSTLKNKFTFNDGAPAETAWRRSSEYAFAQLITRVLSNPQFMLGALWDLDNYKPQSLLTSIAPASLVYYNWKYQTTQLPDISLVKLHSVDTDENGVTVRLHSVLNYIVENLRVRGENPNNIRETLDNTNVNLVYKMAAFADSDNIHVYAEQNSPQTQGNSVKVPQEDYELLLSESVPLDVVNYSGVIITKSDTGYRVTGYDRQYPYFIIYPSNTTTKPKTFAVGSQQFVYYETFQDQPIYVPYDYEFNSKQTIIDFLMSYGEYLRRQGFVFDSQPDQERISWLEAGIQFVKWSAYSWKIGSGKNQRISLVLNPSSSMIKYQPLAGTLQNLLLNNNLILDENQNTVNPGDLDVFRDTGVSYINHLQPYSTISALRSNIVTYEHKLVVRNNTVFGDLIYNPALGIRQNRLRIQGIKTNDWDGTISSAGFLLMFQNVPEWQPNTDYLQGDVVKYKNRNHTALEPIIGNVNFQKDKFSLTDTAYQNRLMPSIGAKALDLEHAYDLGYKNNIGDIGRMRSNTLGYVERSWLANLGLDLENQTEFYRGWIKEKGSQNAVNKFTSAGQSDLLADFTITEEYAVKLGEYGATGRTGFVEVLLQNNTESGNPIAVEFADGENTTNILRYSNSELYLKDINWQSNFVQDAGELLREEGSFVNSGPVLPQEINNYARANTIEYSVELENALTFNTKRDMVETDDVINLMRNIRNGNWIWISVDDTLVKDNKYNVIYWTHSPAKLLKIYKNYAQNTIDLYLDQSVVVTVNDVIAIDLEDGGVKIQGVFFVKNNRIAPTADGVGIVSLVVTNLNDYPFDAITYTSDVALSPIFLQNSLRHSDLGSAEMYASVDKEFLPKNKISYVDNDTNGWAVYQYLEPYNTNDPALNVPNALDSTTLIEESGITTSIAQDDTYRWLWLGKAHEEKVVLRDFQGITLSDGNLDILKTSIATFISSRTDTANLGLQVVSLADGWGAATATDSVSQGQVYIMHHTEDTDSVNQVFRGSSAGAEYGTSIASSTDGNWLVVGEPLTSAAGNVYVYRKFENTSTLNSQTRSGNNVSTVFSLGNVTVTNPYGLLVTVDDNIQAPDVDYTVSGTNIVFDAGSIPGLGVDNIIISELAEYYDLVRTISDPDAGTGGKFGFSVAINSTARTIAIGAPGRDTGKVYVYSRDIQKTYIDADTTTLTLGSTVGAFESVQVKKNGAITTNYTPVNSGDTTITFPTGQLTAGSVIEVDLFKYDFVQDFSGEDTDTEYGYSLAINNKNFLAVGCPRTTNTIGSITISQHGRVELLALNTEVNGIYELDGTALTSSTTKWLRINDWLINSGNSRAELIYNINSLSNVTGVAVDTPVVATAIVDGIVTSTTIQLDSATDITVGQTVIGANISGNSTVTAVDTVINTVTVADAQTIPDGQILAFVSDDNIQLTIDPDKQTTGIVAVGNVSELKAANSYFLTVQNLSNTDTKSVNYGDRLRWVADGMLALVENYTDFINDNEITLDQNTKFDSGSTVLFGNSEQLGQRLQILQLLRTSRIALETSADTVQMARVKTVQYERETPVNLFYTGNLYRLWVGDSNSTDENYNVVLYNNDNVSQGWMLMRQQQPSLEPRSIFRSWIYNSRTKEKAVDLDVVDIANGLLPGALAQHIDYISAVDPAAYGIPVWKSGITYQPGDRVIYNGDIYKATFTNSTVFFNTDYWETSTAVKASNTGSTHWGAAQVGQIWFNTQKLRTVMYEQGDLTDRISNYNRWFSDTKIDCREWVASTVSPAEYANQDGSVDSTAAYAYDVVTKTYYFWVKNKETVGPRHSMSAAGISEGLNYIPESGLPMISAADHNSVIIYNVKNYVDAAEYVLHIDYVTSDHNNRLHDEYLLLSEDNSLKWLRTPIYNKMVDSLSGKDARGLDVPDTNLANEEKYGVALRPRQTMFRNRTKALEIYFQTVNDNLKTVVINNTNSLDYIKLRQPRPEPVINGVIQYSFVVPDRETLLLLNTDEYSENTQVLVESDRATTSAGWSLQKLVTGQWQVVTTEFYNLNQYWKSIDWSDSSYIGQDADFTLDHIGYMQSIAPMAGQLIEILNNGDGQRAVYRYNSDETLDLVFLQNGTIQFLPQLSSGYGYDLLGWDTPGGFDNDPASVLRLIIIALNENILIDRLKFIADRAFFAILRYALQESLSLDWLFRTSFINVKHRVKNLNRKTNYRNDDEQFVKDFINENKPYHTRLREYTNVYSATDVSETAVSDFDLPALYDEVWYKSQFYASRGKPVGYPAGFFQTGLALTVQDGILYVGSTGLPGYTIGTVDGENLNAVSQDWVFALNTYPVEQTTKFAVPVDDAIGIAINGVPFFSVVANQKDSLVWSDDHGVEEIYTINIGVATTYNGPEIAGHGYVTTTGAYVYRVDPVLLYTKNTSQHSPVIGVALDGYPIYGPYGFANSDGTGNIIRNTSSYRLKSSNRLGASEVSNGTQFASYVTPNGEYIEDWKYTPGLGTLDEHNGRFVVTPEYPFGTYAYFVTIDENQNPVYPYIVGPTFKGVPTGLRYEYQGQVNTPIYSNGHYVMPAEAPLANTDWSLRSPNGLSPNDTARWTESPYLNWYQNYSYDLTTDEQLVTNSNFLGRGYISAPEVTISGGGGQGATAVATINTSTGQLNPSVTLTNPGYGYTSKPTVSLTGGFNVWDAETSYSEFDVVSNQDTFFEALMTVPAGTLTSNTTYWVELDETDANYPRQAVVVADIYNGTVRKIASTIRFDRTTSVIESYDVDRTYVAGETVYDSATENFYTSLDLVPASTDLGDEDYWVELTDQEIAETNAANRIAALYKPNNDMLPNVLGQLLDGVDFAGTLVDGSTFTETYQIPTGTLSDADDQYLSQVALNVKFDESHVFDNVFSGLHKIKGNRSGSFSTTEYNTNIQFGFGTNSISYNISGAGVGPRYMYVDTSSSQGHSPDIANLATETDVFTLEFFFRMSTIGSKQVLLDTRGTNASTSGLIVYINTNNELCVSDTDTTTALVNAGSITTNIWQHAVVERKYDTINLYLDGTRLGNYQSSGYQDHSFSDINLTLGAEVDGNNPANALMDELRLTKNLLRYDSAEYTVPVQGHPRGSDSDGYFTSVVLLYGFEGLINEAQSEIRFLTQGSLEVVQDLSSDSKLLTVTNRDQLISGANLSLDPHSVIAIVENDIVNSHKINLSTVDGIRSGMTVSGEGVFNAPVVETVDSGNSQVIVSNVQTSILKNTVLTFTPNTGVTKIPAVIFAQDSGGNLAYLDGGPDSAYSLNEDDFSIECWVNDLEYLVSADVTSNSTVTLNGIQGLYNGLKVVNISGTPTISSIDTANSSILLSATTTLSAGDNLRFVKANVTQTLFTLSDFVTTTANGAVNSNVLVTLDSVDGIVEGMYVESPSIIGDVTVTDIDVTNKIVTLSSNQTFSDNETLKFNLSRFSLSIKLESNSSGSRRVLASIADAYATRLTLVSGYYDYSYYPMFISLERYHQNLRLFVNGVMVDDHYAPYDFGTTESQLPLTIGNAINGYTGKLADFRITNGQSRHATLNLYDTIITSEFTDLTLGTLAADIVVDGSAFVNSITGGSTEEHIDGRVYDTLSVRVFSDSEYGTATAFRIFQDMLGDVNYYAIPASATTVLVEDLVFNDDVIYVSDASAFPVPNTDTNERGVIFVRSERITYLAVDYDTNTLTGIVRGTLGTSTPAIHTTGSRVEVVGVAQWFPGAQGANGVIRTVISNVTSSNVVELNTVNDVAVGMLVQNSRVVTKTATAATASANIVVLETDGIVAGMTIIGPGLQNRTVSSVDTGNSVVVANSAVTIDAGVDMTFTATVLMVNSANSTITTSVNQTFTADTKLALGDIVQDAVQPFDKVKTNTVVWNSNTWYTPGATTAADGNGLQASTSEVAVFLNKNTALLPVEKWNALTVYQLGDSAEYLGVIYECNVSESGPSYSGFPANDFKKITYPVL